MELSKAIELNNRGAKSFLEGKLNDAEKSFKDAFQLDPKNSSLLNNLGLLYHQKKEFEKALIYFKKAIKIEDKASYLINEGNTLAMMGKVEDAKQKYLYTTQKHPDSTGAWISLARLAIHQKELDQAKACWNKAIEIEARPEYLVEYAKVLILQNHLEDALEILYSVSEKSQNPEIWFQIGRVEHLQKNYGIAEKALKKALAEVPDQLDFRHYLAINYMSMGEIDQALYQLDFLLKLYPEHKQILTEKGIVLFSMNQLEMAAQLIDKALKIDPHYQKARHYSQLIKKQ